MAFESIRHQVNLDGLLNRIKIRIRRYPVQFPDIKPPSRPRKERHLTKWSRGKSFCLEGNKLLLVPTNFATVNYLNLEEFTVEYKHYYLIKQPLEEGDYISGNPASLNPFIDDFERTVLRRNFGDYRSRLLRDTNHLMECFYYIMQYVHGIATLKSLMKRWDEAKYMKILQTFLRWSKSCRDAFVMFDGRSDEPDMWTNYRLFLEVLTARCDDSVTIEKALSYLCSSNMRFIMKDDQLIFFLCHLLRTSPMDSRLVELMPKRNVLLRALIGKSIDLMKIALELLECWPEFHSNPIWSMLDTVGNDAPFFSVDPNLWPRKKDQLNEDSFNSTECCAAFSYLTILITRLYFSASEYESLPCFKLLWRAIPTPYLPIEDMKAAAHFPTQERNEEFWESVASLFEDDPPTEYKPRSLKHLSRYAVRRRCRSPEDISSLPLPGKLKRYLLLEC